MAEMPYAPIRKMYPAKKAREMIQSILKRLKDWPRTADVVAGKSPAPRL